MKGYEELDQWISNKLFLDIVTLKDKLMLERIHSIIKICKESALSNDSLEVMSLSEELYDLLNQQIYRSSSKIDLR